MIARMCWTRCSVFLFDVEERPGSMQATDAVGTIEAEEVTLDDDAL